jgi:hypothetical protein
MEIEKFNRHFPGEFARSAVEVNDERQVATVIEAAEGGLRDLGAAEWEVRDFSEDVSAAGGRNSPAYLGSK